MMHRVVDTILTHYNEPEHKKVKMSHNLLSKWSQKKQKSGEILKGVQPVSVAQLRESIGFKVKRFRHLVQFVAEIGYFNGHFNLLYRGQTRDYKDKKGRSRIYPTIYRPLAEKPAIRSVLIAERYKKLKEIRTLLHKYLRPTPLRKGLANYPEYAWALIQHYEIHPTPLIDLTQSLRVAATFALREGASGYVLVFGMPHPQGSISHFVDQEMVLVKLQNVCPPHALRPHYQEGYLVGKLPFNLQKEVGDNLARRMIGKYVVDNSDGKFWDSKFTSIPDDALFPRKDPFKIGFESILKDHMGSDFRIDILSQ